MKRLLTPLGILALVSLFLFSTISADGFKRASPLRPQVLYAPRAISGLEAICDLQNHNDTADKYFASFVSGDRVAAYIDPAVCDTPQYPYEIEGAWLTLFSDFGGTWPVQVALEVWGTSAGGMCDGPITLIQSDTFNLGETAFKLPNIGALVFSKPVCVSGPFFIAVEYTGGTPAPFPSIILDSQKPGDSCGNWGYSTGFNWNKWNHYWNTPVPGNPIVWVMGQTQSSVCTSPSCCVGTTGNINGLGIVDLVDLSALISYLTGGGFVLPCSDAANVNASGIIDLVDLSSLISYLTGGGFTLPSCP